MKLLISVPPVTPEVDSDEVYSRFNTQLALESLPIMRTGYSN